MKLAMQIGKGTLPDKELIKLDAPSLTMVEILKQRAVIQSHEVLYSMLGFTESEDMVESRLTYGELDHEAKKIAVYLQQLGSEGECALLLYPHSFDFVKAFFGCLYAGVIAIPTYQNLSSRYIYRIEAILRDSKAKYFLTTHEIMKKLKGVLEKNNISIQNITWIITDELMLDQQSIQSYQDVPINRSSIAYLQYTSGSTSSPKGVIINHGNVMHNESLLYRSCEHSRNTRGVNWLPYYHDMGLILGYLQPLYGGFRQYILSPVTFLQKPLRWLRTISQFKGTTAHGPNFCFDLCVNSIDDEQKKSLDLSSWKVAINGAEPIRLNTLQRFYEAFKKCGFRYETFKTGYGLAEATLMVAIADNIKPPASLEVNSKDYEKNQIIKAGPDSEKTNIIVGSGQAQGDIKVAIVNPETLQRCPPGRIGEIWANSPSNAQGYWQNPEKTKETFEAQLQDTKEGPFLRTGDLGFIDGNELYVTGRLKDLIIIRGVNYYPTDIELTVEQSHKAILANGGAAFSVDVNNEERLVVVYELKRTAVHNANFSEIADCIRKAVLEKHELLTSAILLLKPASIPKTTSGKNQHQQCKTMFLNNEFNELYRSELDLSQKSYEDSYVDRLFLLQLEPSLRKNTLAKYLNDQCAALLKIESSQINQENNLVSLGFDSLTLINFKQIILERFIVDLPETFLFEPDINLQRIMEIILKSLDKSETVEGQTKLIIQKEKRYEPFPLTDLQYAYWIGGNKQFELSGVAAHAYLEIDVNDETIDYQRLNAAWQKVIERHEMLRMIMNAEGQQQILAEAPKYQIKLFDLREEPEPKALIKLAEIREKLSHLVLSKEQWPLFDISLSLLNERQSRIHLYFDLLIADIWSLNILFKEWYLFYSQQTSLLVPINISYRDYVMTLQAIKESRLYENSKAYWQNRILTLPSAPQLPLSKTPDRLSKARFAHWHAKLDSLKWKELKIKAAKFGLTPSNIIMAAFAKILSSWSRAAKFTLNLTLFNRLNLHPQISNLVGDFTSVILLEVDDTVLRGFKDFAVALQRQLAIDLEHRYYSGVEVIRDLGKKNDDKTKPLMPVVFTSALSTQEELVFNSTTSFFGEQGYTISETPQVWLDHQVYEEEGELVLSWDVVEELFPKDMPDQMFETYISLVNQLASQDQIWEQQIRSLLPEGGLEKWKIYNETDNVIPDELLHTAFIREAQFRPDLPAIFTADKKISYGELLRAATKIAYFLRQINIKPNQLVPIFMYKGWEQIVAVMGILQAGGAYVSLDPDLPPERLRYLIENSNAQTIIYQPDLTEQVLSFTEMTGLAVDEALLRDGPDLDPLDPIQKPDDLAYVIYTSGSTGVPKGVMISHRSAFNTVFDINQRFQITPHDRILALSNLSFDLSVYDIFGMLSIGGALVIPNPHSERNPDHLLELMERDHVTVWNSVPALMELFIENIECRRRKFNLKLALLSGDWIQVTLPGRLWNAAQNVNIVSLGGATEASIWSIYYPIHSVNESWTSIPYGKPLSNQKIYILNDLLGLCPPWVTGEIYIGGCGVAKGYWGDPEKTGRAFITHPENGEIIYKTGDLGRLMPDGNIEFLGREDFQVKIGGFRVEIGEIESTLNLHPQIRQAAVKKVRGKEGTEFLTGYIVLNMAGKLENEAAATTTDYAAEIISSSGEELILNPQARLIFKLNKPGIRMIDEEKTYDLAGEAINPETYLRRGSSRRFLTKSISKSQFGNFLSCLRMVEYDGLPKYRYASAGGLYPVQVYLQIKPDRIEGIDGGTYYYHPGNHQLIQINRESSVDASVHVNANRNIYENAAFSIFLIGQLKAIKPMYGIRSKDFCLLEAGLISQLIETSGMANNIGICQIGAFTDEGFVSDLFRLDNQQILLHAMLCGSVDYEDSLRSLTVGTEFNTTASHNRNIRDAVAKYCNEKLPRYMVPTQWVILDQLPLTSVGKISYKELPKPVLPSNEKNQLPIDTSGSQFEVIITNLLEEKLGVHNLDVYTNFFELGADSLTIVKFWRELVQHTGISFPVAKVFEYPNISKLANFMEQISSNRPKDNDDGDYKKKAEQQRNMLRRRQLVKE